MPISGLVASLLRVADTAAADGNHATAARIYRRVRGLAPGRIAPVLGLARSARGMHDNRSSVSAYRDVLALDPGHGPALREYGRVLMALGAPAEAIPHLEAALKQRPDAEQHDQLGVAHDLIGAHDEAQAQYRAGLALAPGDLTLRANLGRSLVFSRRFGEAITTLRAVAASPESTPEHREALALAHSASGDLGSAIRVTRNDPKPLNSEDRRDHYARFGDMARTGDRGDLAELVAGTGGSAITAAPTALGGHENNTKTAFASAPANTRRNGLLPEPTANIMVEDMAHGPKRGISSNLAGIAPAVGPVYRVQIAAYQSIKRAEKGWRQFLDAAPDTLRDMNHVVIPPNPRHDWDRLFRLRTAAFPGRQAAVDLCETLKKRNLSCIVVRTTRHSTWNEAGISQNRLLYSDQLGPDAGAGTNPR